MADFATAEAARSLQPGRMPPAIDITLHSNANVASFHCQLLELARAPREGACVERAGRTFRVSGVTPQLLNAVADSQDVHTIQPVGSVVFCGNVTPNIMGVDVVHVVGSGRQT
jgi:hypothetical protein